MNKLIIMGRLGKDPIAVGTVAKFSLATDRYNGPNSPPSTDWHSCVAFGKTAEVALKMLRKGDKVLVEGSVKYGSWTKDDGTKGYSTEIIVDRLHLVGGGSKGPEQEQAHSPSTDDMPF